MTFYVIRIVVQKLLNRSLEGGFKSKNVQANLSTIKLKTTKLSTREVRWRQHTACVPRDTR